MEFSDKDNNFILMKNLHDSAWNSLWDFFSDNLQYKAIYR